MNFLKKYKKIFFIIVVIVYLLASVIYLFKNEDANLAIVYVQLKEEVKSSDIESLKSNLLKGNNNLEFESKTSEDVYSDILSLYGDKALNESSKELIRDFLIVKCKMTQVNNIRELSKLNDVVENSYSLRSEFVDSYNDRIFKDKLIVILISGIALGVVLGVINWFFTYKKA